MEMVSDTIRAVRPITVPSSDTPHPIVAGRITAPSILTPGITTISAITTGMPVLMGNTTMGRTIEGRYTAAGTAVPNRMGLDPACLSFDIAS